MARDGYEADKNDVKIMIGNPEKNKPYTQVGMKVFQEMFFGVQIQK
jgi:hypothetical protein